MKPASIGMPAIDAALIVATILVGVHPRPTGGSSRMSRVPVWWSRMPTTMNSAALNTAWDMRITMPAVVIAGLPAPNSTIMKPSWLTVP